MPNRLIHEKSPYLLQHAHNPVDWFPWSDEAFAKAAKEQKPVFLSVGYATCHWCHVMERESFENEGIAKILNEHFVAIKVDREERPDVDRLYMLFVQLATQSGGWPMSVWLTPERKPFFGGTYFPPDSRYGRPGFGAILLRLTEAWRDDRARIETSGTAVLQQLSEHAALPNGERIANKEAWDTAFNGFRRMFDTQLGGFGSAPKFPRPSIHNFLVRYSAETNNDDALKMVLKTLREMVKGGMNDQLGGGFHRYSVDERWFVPHFEKMLYDQAQLAISYLEAFQITREKEFAVAARGILDYVLRDMTHPDGGFYSAEDADSAADPAHPHEKGEGAFYIWTKSEIGVALGEKFSETFCYRYGVRDGGNADEDPHGEFGGRNILFAEHTLAETAAFAKMSEDAAEKLLDDAREELLAVRSKRPRPLLDDKVLACWNGMMISAFAKAAQVLGDDAYEQAARRSANFLHLHLWDDGRQILKRRHRDGESAIDGFLDDYAFVGLGLLDLYETTFSSAELQWSIGLAERAMELFEDRESGGFFSAAEGDTLLRLKDDYDGAEPSGNSAIAILLARLARMTGREDFRAASENTLKAFTSRLEQMGTGVPQMMVAHMFMLGKPQEIVLAGPALPEFASIIRDHFRPNAIIMRAEDVSHPMPALDGKPTVYVCQNFACQLPVTDPQSLRQQLIE